MDNRTKANLTFPHGSSFPFACVDCRRSFKRLYAAERQRPCPSCGKPAVMLDRKFKTPRAGDRKQWEKVRRLLQAGFRFGTVRHHLYGGAYQTARYPEHLREVDGFVRDYGTRPGRDVVGRDGLRGFEG